MRFKVKEMAAEVKYTEGCSILAKITAKHESLES